MMAEILGKETGYCKGCGDSMQRLKRFVSLDILPWPDPDEAARFSIEALRRYLNPA
jgi:hypothetical protein